MQNAASIDHIEGRLAFLRAELKIGNDQRKTWDHFADRIRESAQKLGDVRNGPMMMKPANGQTSSVLPQKLDLEDRLLKARLDLVGAYRTLYSALSEDQKKIAEELLVAHRDMCGPAMMPMGGP
ncbi:Spy/CpxP family protein refolding chaperone [Nordella sp. HKS 07]|uniref:Spy/CpxP family protein refolding chaperone n=1 Tax=Nordella sp. HKS 07 TaxID=2712222 RepID=UPI00352F888A